ncbi:MAG: bifunctional indole-3-glycerol phosphate synthase/phosphoribosylanthranilate isomerase [Saprospiraceae bacterium]
MNILDKIVESKKLEVKALYERYDLRVLKEGLASNQPFSSPSPLFYQGLAKAHLEGKPFFITEFKRKSPSEAWINQHAVLPDQIRAYAQAGASAISVLTDEPFFGGTFEDLKIARQTLDAGNWTIDPGLSTPLLLQKDFVLDPIQVFLARHYGADIILLIAAILQADQLESLKRLAESIGLGVLVEVHDHEELVKVQHLDIKALGVNNRDLKTFRTSLNRVNVLKKMAGPGFIVAESGVLDYRHFQMVRNADGFLIGTGLMRDKEQGLPQSGLAEHFQSHGKFLFKACGIRTAEILQDLKAWNRQSPEPDYIGINFSPVSKRRVDGQTSEVFKTSEVCPSVAVAVFYKNSESEILDILEKHPFRTVQLYAGDVSPEFVRSIKQRVILAVKINGQIPWDQTFSTLIEPYAADVDCFILDAANPGSGERIEADIPAEFPYPFLIAGGLNEANLNVVLDYKNCIGVDIASGIETNGEVDLEKIGQIAKHLAALSLPHDLQNRL